MIYFKHLAFVTSVQLYASANLIGCLKLTFFLEYKGNLERNKMFNSRENNRVVYFKNSFCNKDTLFGRNRAIRVLRCFDDQ